MQAIILASGVNSRVRHLFPTLPKAMFPFGDKPFLAHFLDLRFKEGFDDIIIVVHYHPEVIIDYVNSRPENERSKIKVIRREAEDGPWGALVKAENLLAEKFFLFYCDILYPIPDPQKLVGVSAPFLVTTLITQDQLGMFDRMEIEIDHNKNLVKNFTPDAYEHGTGWMDVGQINSKKIIEEIKQLPPDTEHLNQLLWPKLIRNEQLAYAEIGPVFDIGTEKSYRLSVELFTKHGIEILNQKFKNEKVKLSGRRIA